MIRTAFITAIAAFASGFVAAVAETPVGEAAPAMQEFGDWRLRCQRLPGALPCDIVQAIAHKDTGARLVMLSVAYSPQAGSHVIQILTPLGIDLRKGVELAVGAVTATGIRPNRCEMEGCAIEAILADDMIEAFRNNETGTLSFYPGPGGERLSIEFSLKGFSDAREALAAEIALNAKSD